MNNAPLATALREAAAKKDYAAIVAEEDRLAALAPRFPAALITPPLLHSIDGRRHGRARYDVLLRLLDDGAKLPQNDRNLRRQQLEADAIAIFTGLSNEEFVISVESLTVNHQPFATTARGDVSVAAKARVLIWF